MDRCFGFVKLVERFEPEPGHTAENSFRQGWNTTVLLEELEEMTVEREIWALE